MINIFNRNLLFIFYITTMISCNNSSEKNRKVFENRNDSVKNFVDTSKVSSPITPITKYYQGGNKESEGILKNGIKEGIAKLYYDNGQLKQEGLWHNDKQEGIWKFYNEDGSLSAKVSFKNDLQDGLTVFYFSNGIISEQTYWKQGKLNGTSKEYYANSSLKRITKWINGSRIEEKKYDSSINTNFLKDVVQ